MIISALAMAATLCHAQTWAPDVSGLAARMRSQRAADPAAVAAALQTPQGIAAVRSAFDKAIARGLMLRFAQPVVRIAGDAWPENPIARAAIIPEAAGQASLWLGRLKLSEAREPALKLMLRIAAHPEDRSAVAADYARDAALSERLDGDGNGHILGNWLRFGASGVPLAKAQAILGRTVLSDLENGCERYPFDQDVWVAPGAQVVGLWHLHPPRIVNGAWFDGDVPGSTDGGPQPSDWDRQLGAANGHNLTLVFRKGGFDAYDATGAGSRLLAIYRSPSWAPHFAPALARLTAP